MQTLNKISQDLIKELSFARTQLTTIPQEEKIKTSRAVSALAIIYESARNAIEFQAEHLIRQGAIGRILKRRLFLNQPSQKLASLLIRELLWARYLKEGTVSTDKIKVVTKIIEKYRFSIDQVNQKAFQKKNGLTEWLLGVAACEIEENLVLNPFQQIMINYVSASLSERLIFEEKNLTTKSIQIYVATERGFAQNSETLISYRLLKSFLPEWFQTNPKLDANLHQRLAEAQKLIFDQLNYPLKGELRRWVIKMSPPFNLIRELYEQESEDFEKIIKNPEILSKRAAELLEKLYGETRDKVVRASRRSIVYIFLTKMVIGLSLELPFDLFLGSPNYVALSINSLFPPFMMFLLNIGIKLPSEENTAKMSKKIEEYFYNDEKASPVVIESHAKRRGFEKLFYAVYILTFILAFGGIIWGLRLLHFNFVSQIIFLFFLTIVSFFAYRIRQITKDFLLQEEEKEGFISSFLDFFFLPIIKVGQWLSIKISYFNVISFIFDFIIEAPLKIFLEVTEEWIHFVRTKREEIIT